MAAPLRVLGTLKLATMLLVFTGVGAVAVVGAGVSIPIVVSMSKDKVIEVKDLKDEYAVTYNGESLDLSSVVITLGNGLSSEHRSISGDKLKVEGFDPNCISDPQEVTVSYLDFSKKITVVVNPKKLGTPVTTFDANTGIMTWEPVTDATGYKLSLTDPLTDTYITGYNTDATLYDFNSIQFYSEFNVEVTAVSDKKGSNGKSAFYDGDPSEKKALMKVAEVTNLRYDLENGKFTWNAIEGVSSYEVRVNDSTHRPTTNELPFNTANPGIYNVSIRAIGTSPNSYSTLVQQEFRRLPTPSLTFVNGSIVASNGEAGIVYYDGGNVFSGNASDLSVAGDHYITAQNVHRTDYEIDSAISETLILKKMSAPTLILEDGYLTIDGKPEDNQVQLYLDGQEINFGVNPFPIDSKTLASRINDPGLHKLTAKILGNANQIDSQVSGEVSVTKLAAPSIDFNGEIFTMSNRDVGFSYSITKQGGDPITRTDGFDDNGVIDSSIINALEAGEYTITSVNNGNGNEILNSVKSNQVRFLVPDVDVVHGSKERYDADYQGTLQYATFKATHDMDGVGQFPLTIDLKWWKDGESEPFSTQTKNNGELVAYPSDMASSVAALEVGFKRGNKIADYIEYQVHVDIDFGSVQVLKKSFPAKTVRP